MNDIEEIRVDRINEHKQEIYEELQHKKNMYEDRDYAIESVANEIDEANEILRKASAKLFEYGYNISPIELLSEAQ